MKREIDRYTCDGCGKVKELKHGEPATELFFTFGWFAFVGIYHEQKHACSKDCYKKLSNRMTGK